MLIVLIPKVVYQVCSTVCITYLHTVGHVLIVLIPKVVYQVCSTVCITFSRSCVNSINTQSSVPVVLYVLHTYIQ